jgi:DNA-binding MurR/RpiR family transcriptional regulator
VFTATHLAGALLGAAFAVLLGLGSSLVLARFGQQRLMRWPAALFTALAIVAAAVLGARLA